MIMELKALSQLFPATRGAADIQQDPSCPYFSYQVGQAVDKYAGGKEGHRGDINILQ